MNHFMIPQMSTLSEVVASLSTASNSPLLPPVFPPVSSSQRGQIGMSLQDMFCFYATVAPIVHASMRQLEPEQRTSLMCMKNERNTIDNRNHDSCLKLAPGHPILSCPGGVSLYEMHALALHTSLQRLLIDMPSRSLALNRSAKTTATEGTSNEESGTETSSSTPPRVLFQVYSFSTEAPRSTREALKQAGLDDDLGSEPVVPLNEGIVPATAELPLRDATDTLTFCSSLFNLFSKVSPANHVVSRFSCSSQSLDHYLRVMGNSLQTKEIFAGRSQSVNQKAFGDINATVLPLLILVCCRPKLDYSTLHCGFSGAFLLFYYYHMYVQCSETLHHRLPSSLLLSDFGRFAETHFRDTTSQTICESLMMTLTAIDDHVLLVFVYATI